jgi:hypothetical protein
MDVLARCVCGHGPIQHIPECQGFMPDRHGGRSASCGCERFVARPDTDRGAVEALCEVKRVTGTSTEAWHIAARALEAMGVEPIINRGR